MPDPNPANADAKPDPNTPATSANAGEGKSEPSKSLLGSNPPAPKEGEPPKPDAAKDGKPAEGKDGKPAEKGEEKIDLKVPEGFEADPKALESFTALAKEVGLKSDGAQKVVDLFVGIQREQAAKIAEQVKTWEKEITSKPGYEKELGLAKKALAKLADEDTRVLLEGTWMGSHPGVIRLLAKAGELVAEDKLLEGGQGSKEFTADDFYPTMKKK